MIENVALGKNVSIRFPELVNLYGCEIGDHTAIGPFVEIQKGVIVGRLCKVESHTFLCSGCVIGDRCFVGHHVCFTNDLFPAIDCAPARLFQTIVEDDVVIGSGATILPCRIGQGAVIAAGAVVTRDVEPWTLVVGNPADVRVVFVDDADRNRYFAEHERDHLQPVPRRGSHA